MSDLVQRQAFLANAVTCKTESPPTAGVLGVLIMEFVGVGWLIDS